MNHSNIEKAVLRLIPVVCLLGVLSVNLHHINWRPRPKTSPTTQACSAKVGITIQPIKAECVAKMRS